MSVTAPVPLDPSAGTPVVWHRQVEQQHRGQDAPPAPAPTPTPPPAAPVPTPPPAPTAVPTPPPAGPQSVDQLPEWAQKELRDARNDAAKYRTSAQTAGQAAQQELVDKLAGALGLKPGNEPADPAKLTEQLTAAQKAQKDAAVQLAVYRAAGTHQGNPDALLDSNTFLASVQSLDPTSSDFSTQVDAAVKAAIDKNSTLRLVQATGASAVDHPGSPGEIGQITDAQLAQMTPEQIDQAFREGRLNSLLG